MSLIMAILEVIVFAKAGVEHCEGFSLALSIISTVMHPLTSFIGLMVSTIFICING